MDAQIIKPSGVAVKGHQGRTRRSAGGCGRLHTGRKQKIKLQRRCRDEQMDKAAGGAVVCLPAVYFLCTSRK